ncbi:MAG: hypothetical protein NTX38_00200, partial [Methylobacter sp.]|nr:hypothetical protein [Methylobacter sp.]
INSMSVSFKNHGFTIDVATGGNPIESWLETQHDLLTVLQSEDENTLSKHSHTLELLRNLLPDIETAQKMIK